MRGMVPGLHTKILILPENLQNSSSLMMLNNHLIQRAFGTRIWAIKYLAVKSWNLTLAGTGAMFRVRRFIWQ